MNRLFVLSLTLLSVGCAPRHFILTRDASRELLLPPGVRPGAGPELQCPESTTPFTPRASHYSVHGCYVRDGFVDLQPGMRLKIVQPVLANGQPLQTEVTAQQGLNLTARTNAIGVETRLVEVSALGFPRDIVHHRLFFLARDLGRERKITLIGARTRADLDDATHSLEAYCAAPESPCLAVSTGMVIGAQIPVTVRGQTRYVPLGASLREVVPDGVSQVQLRRLWKGRMLFVRRGGPSAPALSGLPLNGGDSISW
jgi:hypothetical protein